jgi:hypothetical protein
MLTLLWRLLWDFKICISSFFILLGTGKTVRRQKWVCCPPETKSSVAVVALVNQLQNGARLWIIYRGSSHIGIRLAGALIVVWARQISAVGNTRRLIRPPRAQTASWHVINQLFSARRAQLSRSQWQPSRELKILSLSGACAGGQGFVYVKHTMSCSRVER